MEEKYKKFIEYNWENSDEWHSYFRNIFPTPPQNKVLRYKKKFYRNKIDPDFDIDYKPINYKEEEPVKSNYEYNNINNNDSKPSSSSNNTNNTSSYSKTPLLNIETVLMILFLFSLFLKYNSKLIAIITLLMRTIRLVGTPKFEMSYLYQLLKKESFQTLIFAIQLLTYKFNYFLMVPIIIYIIVAICGNIKMYNLSLGKINEIVNLINNKKEDLLQDKSDIEVGMVIFLFVGIFFKINSILLFIIYIQTLYIKYNFNFRLQRSFNTLNTFINNFKNSNSCPATVKSIIQKIQNMFEYLRNTQTNMK